MDHKKIAIIGCGGSGKTTLAFKVQERLGLPLYHLDQYFWRPNWQRADLAAFQETHNALCEQEAWIIEGSYIRFLYPRLVHADVIIFLDLPRYQCLWHVIKRSALNLGKIIPGNPNCKQQLFSFKFLHFLAWIWGFNKKHRGSILYSLEEFKDCKQIYVLHSLKEIDSFLAELK